jgi:hypothetical protein
MSHNVEHVLRFARERSAKLGREGFVGDQIAVGDV